jgi:glycosyltransferase involved in cell wall biosynthesis
LIVSHRDLPPETFILRDVLVENDIVETMARIPVLLLVRELGIGGCERDVTKVAIGLDRKRFEAHVAAFHTVGLRTGELQAAGIPIVHLPVTSFRSWSAVSAARKMRAYIKRHRIQVVHAYDVPTDLFAAPVARLSGVPVVFTSQLSHRALYRPVTRKILRFTDRISDRVVVNCEAVRRHMIEDEGVSPDRIYLCYNGVDTSIFYPSSGIAEKPGVLSNAPFVIGSVCFLRAEKRIDLLLEAFARVRQLRPRMKLFLLGGGPQLEELTALVRQLGIENDCIFHPAESQVAGWLRAIDIFVLPSDSEAFSNALLEAMACGCCPIGSRVGGTPELINDGHNGLLFRKGDVADLTDKLARAITDDELRHRFGCASAARARDEFPIGRTVSRMEDIYDGLVASKLRIER